MDLAIENETPWTGTFYCSGPGGNTPVNWGFYIQELTGSVTALTPTEIQVGESITWKINTNSGDCRDWATGTPYPANTNFTRTFNTVGNFNHSIYCYAGSNYRNVGHLQYAVLPTSVDTHPDSFQFSDAAFVQPAALVISNPITVGGFEESLTATVSGEGSPQLSVNDGAWATSVQVTAGDSLRVSMMSGPTFGVIVRTATIDINGVSTVWHSYTADTPQSSVAPFSFTNIGDASPGSLVESASVVISGPAHPVTAMVSGQGSPEISVNGGPWTTGATIYHGYSIKVRMTSASTPSATRMATVNVYGRTADWSVTTAASTTVCTGYQAAPVSLDGMPLGTYQYLVTGTDSGYLVGTGVYTDDSVIAKAAVHAGLVMIGGKAVITVSKMGGQSEYSGSTQNGVSSVGYGEWDGSYTLSLDQHCGAGSAPYVDGVPDAFSFINQSGIQPSSQVVSGAVPITGFDGSLTATVSGDGNPQLSTDGVNWAGSGAITAGQNIQVRMTSAASYSATSSATVNINGVTAGWSVTTGSAPPPPPQNAPQILSIAARQGANTIQNGEITIAQDEGLTVEFAVRNAESCVVNDVEVPVEYDPVSASTRLEINKYFFEEGSYDFGIECSGPNGTADTAEFELNVVEDENNPKADPPVINELLVNGIDYVVEGHPTAAFPRDATVAYSYVVSNANQCYAYNGITTWQMPAGNHSGSFAEFQFEQGPFEYVFSCTGDGGMSQIIVALNVGPPTTVPTPPSPDLIADEYTAFVEPASGRIRVQPTNSQLPSSLGEFVLAGGTGGYTVGGPAVGDWISSAVELLTGDYNADGLNDMLIKNIAPGANPVIVYANQFGTTPVSLVEVNDQFRQFFNEFYHVVEDPEYFVEHAISENITVFYWDWVPILVCGFAFDFLYTDIGFGFQCGYNNVLGLFSYTYKEVLKDLGNGQTGHFHPGVGEEFVGSVGSIVDSGRIIAGSDSALHLSGAIRTVLGGPFMGSVLGDGGLLGDELDLDPSALDESRYDRFYFWLHRMIKDVLSDEITLTQPLENIPSNVTKPDEVLLTEVRSEFDTYGPLEEKIVIDETNSSRTKITIPVKIYSSQVSLYGKVSNAIENGWDGTYQRTDSQGVVLHEYEVDVVPEYISFQVSLGGASTYDFSVVEHWDPNYRAKVDPNGPRKVMNLPRNVLNSTIEHEFCHILGCEDQYDDYNANNVKLATRGTPEAAYTKTQPGFDADIMGGGNKKPWYIFEAMRQEYKEAQATLP